MTTLAILMVGYACVATWLGPRPLARLTRSVISPGLSVVVWLVAVMSVVGAWVGALAVATADVLSDALHGRVPSLCVEIAGRVGHVGLPGALGWVVAIAAMAFGYLVTVRWARRVVLVARRLTRQSYQHAIMARAVGTHTNVPGVVVVSATRPAVYCVAGRCPAIVVTSAALTALDAPELAAVLAHERAHLSGRHHLLLTILRSLATTLSRLPLFAAAAAAVPPLLEMCADDRAARRYGAAPLLRGLLALVGGAPAPAEVLGAAESAVLVRSRRLAAPPTAGRQWRHRLTIAAIVTAIAALPILFAAALLCQR
ncbi:M56 family metallopeptidase [Metapseudomonas otitidis]